MDSVLIAPMAAESAVLVPVPEAERAVGGHRDRLDRAAAWGVPAHVTVLYPFVAPPAITATVIAGLADAVGTATAAAAPERYQTARPMDAEEVRARTRPRLRAQHSRFCCAGGQRPQ